MRGTSRSGSNQYGSNQYGSQSRDSFRDSRSDRDDSSRDSDEDFRGQNQRGQSQRDSSRDNDRDDFRSQGQRDFSRDNDRDQFSDQRGQFSDQRGSRESFDNSRASQSGRSDQFQSGRSDQSQSGRFDQRSGQSGFQGSTRGAASNQASVSGGQQQQITRAADMGLWFNRNNRNGLVISDVSSSGPISRFGFQEGDQIMSVNGNRVASEQQFLNLLTSPQFMNQRAQVAVWRNGQQVPVWVEPWTLMQGGSSGGGSAQSDPLHSYGIVLDDRYQSPVVWKVLPQSPAHYAGIRGNDVIVAWNGQHVNDPHELVSAAQQTEQSEIPVQLSRNRQLRNVTLEADGQNRTALRPSYEESYDNSSTSQQGSYQQGYGQPQGFQQGYTQPQTFQQSGYTQGQTYVQPGTTYAQPGTTYGQAQSGTYVQPQQGTYQQNNRPGILPWIRGR